MFSLHETQRIYVCRAAFVLLCAVPTFGVVAWAVFVRAPAYRHWHERAIARELQCTARMTRASNPRPELVLYENLDLTDRETGQLLARFPAVEVETTNQAVVVRLPMPGTINGRRLADLWQLALAQARAVDAGLPVRIEAGHLTLSLADGNQTLTELACQLDRESRGSTLSCSFRRAAAPDAAATPLAITITRDRSTVPGGTDVVMSTGGSALPCDLLATAWPELRSLGRECLVCGTLRAREVASGWTFQLEGRADGIDLDRLMALFPHKLTGIASLELEQAQLRDGRIESAKGAVHAGPGTISRSLVQAAMSSLRLESAPRAFAGRENRVAYSELAASFALGADGLSLKGRVNGEPGAVLVSGDLVLLKEPTIEKQPVLNLVRTLVPQVALQVPATRETDRLTRLLPVPPVAVPPGQETALPEARSLRVAPTQR